MASKLDHVANDIRDVKLDGGKDHDPVHHPSHYTGFSNGAEVIDIIEHLTANRAMAVKYLARAGKKELADELQDLEKAAWYTAREIQLVRAKREFGHAEEGTE